MKRNVEIEMPGVTAECVVCYKEIKTMYIDEKGIYHNSCAKCYTDNTEYFEELLENRKKLENEIMFIYDD